MKNNISNIDSTQIQNQEFPASYREQTIKGTLYHVTSVYLGEKELGAVLEKLAVQRVLDEMDGRVKKLLRA